ncbi:5383_t:CDS:2 [Cetraspora pellucida]|uniref:5383_t:CDS:1 n=1 Tax=Cetraspora pellucida TaxID=1433469 RepID=A0A9N9BKM9_9GLOM|nr:5383_t:CDS:2 [Cetraspora pellucida]
MHKLGFWYQCYQKGAYIDGHKCPNVVKYRQKFLEVVSQLEQLMSKWVDPECKIRTFLDLNNSKKEHIWMTHNETTFYIYDRLHSMWGPEKEQLLQKKGLGSAVHVSDFLTETIRPFKDEQEEAHLMMVLDTNQDGYWDSKKLLEQVAFAEDALVASKMNLGPVGSVLKMQDIMQPKGIQWVLSNRGLWKDNFLEQCGQIQQEIESCRHKVLFYPKFHPEFNYIEIKTICEAFDSISVKQIHYFARLSYRWMDVYHYGLTEKVAEYAVKKSRKHRTINEEIMNWVSEFLK